MGCVGRDRVNAEAKRSVKGAGAKGESGGFRRRCGPCAFVPQRRDFGSSRIEKRGDGAKKWQRRERGPGRERESECGRRRWAESAAEPRAGKIGVRCTLAAILALNRPRRFHLEARLLFLVDRLFAPTNRPFTTDLRQFFASPLPIRSNFQLASSHLQPS